MMTLHGKRILCLSAHADDFELGCGGFIASQAPSVEIWVSVMTMNRRNAHGDLQEERSLDEQLRALDILGIERQRLILPEGIDGQLFPECRQRLLEALYALDKELSPDLVLTTSHHDVHQDHVTLCHCAHKAFKRRSLLGYEVPNSSHGFQPNLAVHINAEAMERKCRAVAAYRSQLQQTTGDYFSSDMIQSLARAKGVRFGLPYAECFEVYWLLTQS
jgi:LmbE family N-acetylglucosaminyl deacetylase